MTTAIDASVSIHDGLALSFVRGMGVLNDSTRLELPNLQLPAEHEADAEAPQRGDFRFLPSVLPQIIDYVEDGQLTPAGRTNNPSILCGWPSSFFVHVTVLQELSRLCFLRVIRVRSI